ncbi:single-stranded DNA-binding protein [Gilvimarinus chinensis]|uniref:single-stranded DNA-binding protein n=1 Tax=Gilvimarinus chinensis TaxID=396005 RepID=UPI0003711102|nr:single-stranded DNA-binding protein [Gilvimarinus chinensis]
MALSIFAHEGNVGSFEYKTVPVKGEEKSVLNVSFRADMKARDESGEWSKDNGFWVDVEFWGKRSKAVAELLKVGARIVVIGEQRMESFQSNDPATPGQEIYRLKVRADSISFAPMGIESIQYKPKAGPANQGYPAEEQSQG